MNKRFPSVASQNVLFQDFFDLLSGFGVNLDCFEKRVENETSENDLRADLRFVAEEITEFPEMGFDYIVFAGCLENVVDLGHVTLSFQPTHKQKYDNLSTKGRKCSKICFLPFLPGPWATLLSAVGSWASTLVVKKRMAITTLALIITFVPSFPTILTTISVSASLSQDHSECSLPQVHII